MSDHFSAVRAVWFLGVGLALVAAACSGGDDEASPAATTPPGAAATAATAATAGATGIPTLSEDIDALLAPFNSGLDLTRIERIGASGELPLAWVLSDMFRFVDSSDTLTALERAFWELTGVPEGSIRGWTGVTNYLIAEDVPAPEGYGEWKRVLYVRFGEGWAPFFDDVDADVDWRLVSWGGVGIDDRPVEQVRERCPGCIPALDDPAVTDAPGGDWYPDDRLVFAVEVNGETRAYPKHQMEVHEMVNDTLGGRRIAVVYCTLCGTAQAFFTDEVPAGIDTPSGVFELRTSGLLARSNKVMFELHTFSFFDTFRGRAVSGPLQDVGLELTPVTVSTATWAEWKAGHPDTSIVAEDGGLGREYPLDPLRGRDDNGPIFPIGDVDPRLPVQDQVLGVRLEGVTVAFPEIAARVALDRGESVEFEGISVHLEAGALSATTSDGEPIATHQSFWFAWSQFYPDTAVWGLD
ncbi:MAG: DUF3179 domain-containing (seleno)protein [Chloroflexi bacterium]|nr:DUF3179 domain-containing (seleno)protein [Chloroflexota bacterium]MDA1147362.1 DUF3179 domain-containing (seleno)protein [Chloroflexota bacterium]